MRQNEITIGSQYRVKIGNRLAPVTVLRRLDGRGRARFVCLTGDTGREVRATAARLRPIPGTVEAVAENRRRVAAAAARQPRPYTGDPGAECVDARPVPEMLGVIGPAPVLRMSEPNRDTIRRIVDRVHVAEPFAAVARTVRRRLGAQITWQTIPRELRRGILYAAAERHAAGRRMYRVAMGHDPLPSERMVADAVGVACGLGRCP